jgi:hypothetical protein
MANSLTFVLLLVGSLLPQPSETTTIKSGFSASGSPPLEGFGSGCLAFDESLFFTDEGEKHFGDRSISAP